MMRFRPCIDVHNGKVKQIVGGSLRDAGDAAEENFSSERSGAYYAELYKKDGLRGGHVILLNPASSPYYEATKAVALDALRAYPKGLQLGGGITPANAEEFLDAGASHVIVTSYVFKDGRIYYDRLEELVHAVGKDRLVLDLSCRKRADGAYVIVTDRWQNFTEERVTVSLMESLAGYCDEFLVHGVDVEGKASGICEGLVEILARYSNRGHDTGKSPLNRVTYAGGIRSLADIKELNERSDGTIDFTIGSALDLFGGSLPYDTVKNTGMIL